MIDHHTTGPVLRLNFRKRLKVSVSLHNGSAYQGLSSGAQVNLVTRRIKQRWSVLDSTNEAFKPTTFLTTLSTARWAVVLRACGIHSGVGSLTDRQDKGFFLLH